jgi:uncharacterized membrane protein YphA (DoxX/SURF4 family)
MIRVSFWTAVFLIALRLCIGWHFAYEGYGKVKSAYLGKATANEKPFSSETYFRESEGPFGKIVKSRIGDPDREVVDKVTLKPVEGDPSKADPKSRFPAALEKEWDDYFNRFATQFKLDDEQKKKAEAAFDQSKADFVKWVGKARTPEEKEAARQESETAKKPEWALLKVKRKAPGAGNASADLDDEVTVAERAAELQKKSADVRAAYANLELMGKDVEGANLRTLKGDVNTIRTELQKEIDDQTKAMKDRLAAVFGTRVTAYATQADNKDVPTTLQAMLTPMTAKDSTNPLGKMWDEYAAFVTDFAPNMNDGKKAEVDRALTEAKARFDRWLNDQDMYTGEPLAEKEVAEWRTLYAAALKRKQAADPLPVTPAKKKDGPEPKRPPVLALLPAYMETVFAGMKADADQEVQTLTARMQAELKTQSDALRAQIGAPLLGDERAKGYVPATSDERTLFIFPKSWTLINYLDWSTRWFLLVVGVLLMIGLFTRPSCFAAAGFLLLTVLTQPSLPWFPAPPNSEGNYLVVNKNVIEMLALLALMTTRSGRWFGLDAIVSWVFGGRRRRRDVEF